MTATGASTGQPADQRLEVGHVLFMDVVGYSKINIEEQKQTIESLQELVRSTNEFQQASAEGRVRPLPTGDGMALVFFVDPEAPLRCAVEVSRALKQNPAIRLRMGIHAGPVYRVGDINANMNVAGGGVNIAQRVMDCGDAGHILTSEETARFFAQVGSWGKSLHDVGNTRVKHGVRLHLFSLYVSEVGNPHLPAKLRRERVRKTTVIGGLLFATAVVSAVFLVSVLHRQGTSKQHVLYHQLTSNDSKLLLNTAVISPNGSFLAYEDARGLFVLDIKSGERNALPVPKEQDFTFSSQNWYLAWSPDSTRVYASGPSNKEPGESIWVFPLVGAVSKRVLDDAELPQIASDGSIAYLEARSYQQIWIKRKEGDKRLLMAAPAESWFTGIAWAPHGDRIAYIQQGPNDNDVLGIVDTSTGSAHEIVTGKKLRSGAQGYDSGLCWSPDGRIIFVAANPPGTTEGSNLWAVPIDLSNGNEAGEPQQITDEVASFQSDLSITADGKVLSFFRYKQKVHVLLAYLPVTGTGSARTDEFVSGESNNWAGHWTADSKDLLITSDRIGDTTNIFKQGLTETNPTPVHPADEIQNGAVVFSKNGALFYWSWPKNPGEKSENRTLNRLNPDGSVSRLNIKSEAEVACALKAPICVLRTGPRHGGNFLLFDPNNFQTTNLPVSRRDVGEIADWDVSPDGKTIAMVHSDQTKGITTLLAVADGSVTDLTVRNWSGFDSVAWSADGTSLYITSNVARKSAVLRVELTGSATVLWQTDIEALDGAVAPSPDGKYAAFSATKTAESNAWYIERF